MCPGQPAKLAKQTHYHSRATVQRTASLVKGVIYNSLVRVDFTVLRLQGWDPLGL